MKFYIHQVKKETTLLDFFQSMKVAKNKINYLIDNSFCYVDGNILKRDSSRISKVEPSFWTLTSFRSFFVNFCKKAAFAGFFPFFTPQVKIYFVISEI